MGMCRDEPYTYSVLHEAALKVVILDNGLISKVEIYYLYKHSIFFRYLLKVVLLFTTVL